MTKRTRLTTLVAAAGLVSALGACGNATSPAGGDATRTVAAGGQTTVATTSTESPANGSTASATAPTETAATSAPDSGPVATETLVPPTAGTTPTEAPTTTGDVPPNPKPTDDIGAGGQPKHATADYGIQVNPEVAADKPALDIYVDFQCPACAAFSKSFAPGMKQVYAAKAVRVVIHPMSFLDKHLANDSSKMMANAFACAADQGKGAQFEQLAMEQQPEEGKGWTDAQATTLAKQAGLNPAQLTEFERCRVANTYATWVGGVDAAATKRGVQGTPTIFLAGKEVDLQKVATVTDLVSLILKK